jgi:hypothetical protein
MPSKFELSEEEIQRAVFKHLDTRPMPGVFSFHPKNASRDMVKSAGIAVGLGVRPGIPDVIVTRYSCGRCDIYALELKRESLRGKKLTVHDNKQLEMRRIMTQFGWITGCAFGLDEALEWLELRQLLRKNLVETKIAG